MLSKMAMFYILHVHLLAILLVEGGCLHVRNARMRVVFMRLQKRLVFSRFCFGKNLYICKNKKIEFC